MRKLLIVAWIALVATPAAAQVAPNGLGGVTPPIFGNPSAVNGGGVFTGQLLAPVTPTDCSAPQYSFQGDTNTGIGYNAADNFRLCAGGFSVATVGSSGGLFVGNAFFFGWGTDVFIAREGASHPIQRSGANAQRASWANTYTSATNYEAFSIDWQTSTNVALVASRTAATGTVRGVLFASQNSNAANQYAGVNTNSGTDPRVRIGLFTNDTTALTVAATGTNVALGVWTNTATSGAINSVSVTPTYNQSSGTASNCDLCIDRTEDAVGSGAQYSIKTGDDGNTRFYVTSGGATGRGTQIGTAQAVAPTCSSNCGTSPLVVGSDTAMLVTMGSSGVPASGWVVTFNGTWALRPSCIVQMAKAGMVVGKMPLTVVTTTTTITVVTNGTAPATTDEYQIICMGRQ